MRLLGSQKMTGPLENYSATRRRFLSCCDQQLIKRLWQACKLCHQSSGGADLLLMRRLSVVHFAVQPSEFRLTGAEYQDHGPLLPGFSDPLAH